MANGEEQMTNESKELRNFKAFAAVAGLPIETASICETLPPKPDIEATLDGAVVAWEVTEGVEPDYAKKLNLMHRTKALIDSEFGKLSSDVRNRLLAVHGSKAIAIGFRDDVERRERVEALKHIFPYLIELPEHLGSTGVGIVDDGLPTTAVTRITFARFGSPGIFWDVAPQGGWINTSNVLRERIVDKMCNKTYETSCPIELLVYLDRQVDPMEVDWVERLSEVAQANLERSPFRRVWLYNSWRDESHCLTG